MTGPASGRVLVTGATGFIGRRLITDLVAAGQEVAAVGRRPLGSLPWPDGVTYYRCDLTSDELPEPALAGVSVVYHLAGASSTKSDLAEMKRVNIDGTERLLAQVGRLTGLERFVHVSSTSVYGETTKLPEPVTEDVEVSPNRDYGKTKLAGEKVVLRYASSGLPAVLLRPVTVYGPGNTKLVASALLDCGLEAYGEVGEILLYPDPVELRIVHLDDMIGALRHVAAADIAPGTIMNVTSGNYPDSHTFGRALAQAVGLPARVMDDACAEPSLEDRRHWLDKMRAEGAADQIVFTAERLRFIRRPNLNNRLSIQALLDSGFTPAVTDLEQSLSATLRWYRQARWIL